MTKNTTSMRACYHQSTRLAYSKNRPTRIEIEIVHQAKEADSVPLGDIKHLPSSSVEYCSGVLIKAQLRIT